MSKTRCFLSLFLVVAFSLALFGGEAGAVLSRVGPVNGAPPVGNFPSWYQDTTGLTLEFCDPKNDLELSGGWCLLLPADVQSVPEEFPGNFADEHFYYAADAIIDTGTIRARLVIGLEAAFAVGPAIPGDQTVFSRIRVRLDDAPFTGTYTFTHPYGQEVIQGTAGERIFFTEDIGILCARGDFTCAMESRLGPFLLPSDEPGGAELPAITGPAPGKLYIADPGRIGPITGSPTGNNIFRIQGPNNFDISTTDFALVGRIFSADNVASPIPAEVTVTRANYTRNSTETKVDVFATAFEATQGRLPTEATPTPALPILSFHDAPCASAEDADGNPIPPYSAPVGATETPMFNAGNNFWGTIPVSAIPTGICVEDNVTASFFPRIVTDEVILSQASWSPLDNTLRVRAASSDTLVPPTLTAAGFATPLAAGSLVVPNLAAPPASITVFSSALGSDTELVRLGIPAATGNAATGMDFDGDGSADIAVWRPGTGPGASIWYVLRSSDGAVAAQQWGDSTDVPVAGDYDGDGLIDYAVWRPGTGPGASIWYVLRSSDGTVVAQQWGDSTDVPKPGDYDGDGSTDYAVWRPSTATWYILQSSDGAVVAQQWGDSTDILP